MSFTVQAGQKVGLVGPVGSGKSTLIALLLRFYDPPRGALTIDGVDVLDVAPRALRRAFAHAPQEPFLFSDSISGNVRFAGSDVADESVSAAVRDSELERDLSDLPDGLGTVVGERGVVLSGGQRQRVSLARALATGPSTALLLDDTLSAVDHATERRILRRLADAQGQRTVVVAAHRLSIVRDADLIVVFEAGRVTAQGRHDDLLRSSRFYAETWRRQSEEAALERGAAFEEE